MTKLRIGIVVGEASGDIHGSQLMMMLKKHDAEAEFVYWGGDQMKSQGGKLTKHISDLAFMGFLEVIMNIITILKNFTLCKKQMTDCNPDAVIATNDGPSGCPVYPADGTFLYYYQTTIDLSTGHLSGYAWSDNVGWVSFEENDAPTYTFSSNCVDDGIAGNDCNTLNNCSTLSQLLR